MSQPYNSAIKTVTPDIPYTGRLLESLGMRMHNLACNAWHRLPDRLQYPFRILGFPETSCLLFHPAQRNPSALTRTSHGPSTL